MPDKDRVNDHRNPERDQVTPRKEAVNMGHVGYEKNDGTSDARADVDQHTSENYSGVDNDVEIMPEQEPDKKDKNK